MKKNLIPSIIISTLFLAGCAETNSSVRNTPNMPTLPQTTKVCSNVKTITERNTYINAYNNSLTCSKDLMKLSKFTYCPEQVNSNGSAFELNYVDAGGKGMDGYPNGGVGGMKLKGKWHPSDKRLTGMPVRLSELSDNMTMQWKVSQTNALDNDDKWMASINMIFDAGTPNSSPSKNNRDYDLVIELNSHNFDNSTTDRKHGKKESYFARNSNGSLRPFTVTVEGKQYHYAVRYKFHRDSGAKNNKVHVKYIPINEANVPPYLNHSVKSFIDNSKEFIKYTRMPSDKRALAEKNVAKSSLYLKSIRAGYEVYKGQSILRNDYFRVVQ
jgi:hypothetical protein